VIKYTHSLVTMMQKKIGNIRVESMHWRSAFKAYILFFVEAVYANKLSYMGSKPLHIYVIGNAEACN
jgi:hypothetical protein